MNDFYKYIEIIEKAKRFPIGTIRRWGNAVYRKVAENQWELIKKLRSKEVPRYTKEGYTIDPESQMEELDNGDDEYGERDIIYISDEEVSRISTDVASIKNLIEDYKLQSTVQIPENADRPRKLFQPLYSFLDRLDYQTFQGSENKKGYLIDGQYMIPIRGLKYTVTEVLDRLGAYHMRDEYLVNARVERWVWNNKKGGYSTDRVRKGLREFVLIVKKDGKTWNIKSLGRLTGEEDDSHYDELNQFFPLLFKGDNNLNNNLAFAASAGRINEIDISPSYDSLIDAQERIKGIDFHSGSPFHSQIINLSLDKIVGEGNQLDINKLNELVDGIQQGKRRINRLSIEEESGRVGGGRESIAASIITGSVEGDRNLSQKDASEKFALSESLIKEYAQKTGTWLDKEELLREFPGRLMDGKESQVFLDEDEGLVLKITSPYITSPNLERFFTDHIALYNYMFPETAYMVKGFLEDEGGFKVVLTQPYIDGKLLIDRTNALTIETFSETCEIERKNIEEDLKKRWKGVERIGENDYANNRYSIDDAHLQNVIVKNGIFYYIDVNPYLVNDDYGEYDMSDNVEKSRKGDPIGTVKIWSGKEWEKTPTGWKPRSKGREKKESGGWGSPKLLGLNAVAVNEFQNKIAAHVKYNGKSYAVTVLTPKEANEQGYTITPSNLQYLTSGVKKSESRDRAILSLLRKTTYSDFKAQSGENPVADFQVETPKGKSGKLVDSFSDETRNFYQEVKDGNEALSDFIDHLIENDYPWDDIKKFVKEEWPELGETLLNGQFNYITKEKAIYKKYYNVDKRYKPIATHISIEGLSNEERANRVMAALQDIQGGASQGTVRNPHELASSMVVKNNQYDYYVYANQLRQKDEMTLIEAIRRGEEVRYNDGWYVVEVDDYFLYVDVTGTATTEGEDYNDRAMITDRFGKALENDIEKGKAVPVGTVREKNGVRWIKTPNGWKYQGKGRKKKVEDPQNPQSSNAPEPTPEVKKQAIEGYAKDASNEQLQNAINSDKQTPEVKEIAQKELEKRGITPSNGNNKEGGENGETNVSPKEKGDSLSALETLLNSSDISDSFKKKIQAEYDRMKGVKAGEDNEKLKQENDALKKENESLKKQSTLQGVDDKQYKRISNLVENSNFVSRNVKLTIDGKDASPYMTKYKGKVKFYMKDENGKKTDSFDTLDEYISAWKGNQGSSTPSTASETKETKVEQQPQSQEKPQSVMDEMEKEDKAAYSKELAEKQKREAAERKKRSEENRRKLNEEAAQREQQKPIEEQKPQEESQEPSFEEQAQKETEKRLNALFKKYPADKDQKEALNYYEEKLEENNRDLKKVIRYYQNKSNIGNIAYRVAFQRFLAKHKKPPIVDDLLFSDYNGESYSGEGAYAYERVQDKLKKSTPQDVSKALKSYTDIGYNAVREYCSGEDYQDSEEMAKMVDDISNFIDKNKLEKNRTLFRCLLNYGGSIDSLLKLKPGDVFRDKSFSSFSNNMLGSFGTDLQITLLAKKGESAANIMNVYEQEYLLQRNKKLRVIAKGFNSIVVEAVD